MARYLISFDRGAMDHIPDEEGPAVGEAAHAAVQEARDAGVFVFAGGVHDAVSLVATDESTFPHARKRSSGLPRLPPPAAAPRSSARS